MIKNDNITAFLRSDVTMATGAMALIRKMKLESSYMGNLSGESREQNRKDKVTRFPSVTYAR